MNASLILLAQIGAAHGIKGEVRVKPFGEPDMLDQYGKLETTDGRKFRIKRMRPQKNMLVVKFEGVNSREEAEALNGTELYIDRAKLPEPDEEDEFYVSDLVGMRAIGLAGEDMGSVIAVPNFGADDLLEIKPKAGSSYYVPFTREAVPEIDFANGTVTINPPDEVSERDDALEDASSLGLSQGSTGQTTDNDAADMAVDPRHKGEDDGERTP